MKRLIAFSGAFLIAATMASAGGIDEPVFPPEPVKMNCGFLGLKCSRVSKSHVVDDRDNTVTIKPSKPPKTEEPVVPVKPEEPVVPVKPVSEDKGQAMDRAFGTRNTKEMTSEQLATREEFYDKRVSESKNDMKNDTNGDGKVDGREAHTAATSSGWETFGK